MAEPKLLLLHVGQLPEVLRQRHDLPAVGSQQARQGGQQRGFAAARRAHEQHELSPAQMQGNIAQGGGGGIPLTKGPRQVPCLQGRRRRQPARSPRQAERPIQPGLSQCQVRVHTGSPHIEKWAWLRPSRSKPQAFSRRAVPESGGPAASLMQQLRRFDAALRSQGRQAGQERHDDRDSRPAPK